MEVVGESGEGMRKVGGDGGGGESGEGRREVGGVREVCSVRTRRRLGPFPL